MAALVERAVVLKDQTIDRVKEIPGGVRKHADDLKAQVDGKLEDQNFMQTFYTTASIMFELYRATTASLLILFVYQECGGQQCTLRQNFMAEYNSFRDMYIGGLVLNFLTLGAFLLLYFVEFRRELYLIEYLEVSDTVRYDNAAVEENLKANLAPEKLDIIRQVDERYKICGRLALLMYALNSVVSAVVIGHYYAGTTTVTSYLTSILFIIKKLISVYGVVYSDLYVFQSGFQSEALQYNDVDPAHRLSMSYQPQLRGSLGSDRDSRQSSSEHGSGSGVLRRSSRKSGSSSRLSVVAVPSMISTNCDSNDDCEQHSPMQMQVGSVGEDRVNNV